jgi:hypothetical protein
VRGRGALRGPPAVLGSPGSSSQVLLTSGRVTPTGHHCRRERPRTGPWWKPQESRVVPARERPTCTLGKALERRIVVLSQGGDEKRKREGAGKPVPRCAGNSSGEASNAQESIGLLHFGGDGYGSSRGAKPWSCGASWPSGPQSRSTRCQKRQEGNGAERRAALRRGKALQGEPHEWHRSFGIGRCWRE